MHVGFESVDNDFLADGGGIDVGGFLNAGFIDDRDAEPIFAVAIGGEEESVLVGVGRTDKVPGLALVPRAEESKFVDIGLRVGLDLDGDFELRLAHVPFVGRSPGADGKQQTGQCKGSETHWSVLP
jgi:hypothetical protein